MIRKRPAGKGEEGFILVAVLLIMLLLSIMGFSILRDSTIQTRIAHNGAKKMQSFNLADSAIEKTLTMANTLGNNFSGWFTDPGRSVLLGDGVTYRTLPGIPGLSFELAGSLIEPVIQGPAEGPYVVTVEAEYRQARTAIEAEMNPELKPAYVFDYTYFINNWGWFYGSGIRASGDVRSNGDFDFRWGPRVNGEIYASGSIVTDRYGIRGSGGDAARRHDGQDKLPMPNLMDLSYYEDLAASRVGTLRYWDESAGEYRTLNQVFGDDEGKDSIYLHGTPSHPLKLDGPVVVRGDIIISGKVSGQGTLYVGGNAYLAGNVDYKNLTGGAPRPASDDPSVTDQWVEAHKDDDLLAVAARGNIIMGDYTGENGGSWYSNYYLFQMGQEDGIGPDGIPDTYDDERPDGVLQTYEDADEDGNLDGNYNWSDIVTDLSDFANIPDGVSRFGQLATNRINKLEGIFYTNHAFAGRTGYGMIVNGSIISKDEAIIYRNTITMNYDERVHSRYLKDPNLYIDLGLPRIRSISMTSWRVL